MNYFCKSGVAAIAFSTALLLGGCGGGDDKWTRDRVQVYPATGVVTYNGNPLADARVFFSPREQDGKAAFGVTDEEGRFELQTFEPGDGAAAGEYRVAVKKVEVLEPDGSLDPEGNLPPPEERSLIPEAYADFEQSGLEATVTADGDNEYRFELVD